MSSFLFETWPAEELNRAVRELRSHLFLLVDYNPGLEAVDERETFARTCLNFYKLMNDAGILRTLNALFENRQQGPKLEAELEILDDAVRRADALRTYLAHNQSEENGWTIRSTQKWLQRSDVIGKGKIETPEDRRKACARVEEEAEKAQASVLEILHVIERRRDREEILDQMEQKMCGYYKTTTGFGILQECMRQLCKGNRTIFPRGEGAGKAAMEPSPYACACALAVEWVRNTQGIDVRENNALKEYRDDIVKRMKKHMRKHDCKVETLLPDGLLTEMLYEDRKMFRVIHVKRDAPSPSVAGK